MGNELTIPKAINTIYIITDKKQANLLGSINNVYRLFKITNVKHMADIFFVVEVFNYIFQAFT